jgi:serine/threonine-protein kinase
MTTERLGKYEIRGTLGKGAMGTVYSAWDPIISRTVAIKTVRLPEASDIDAQEELARFKREAQAAGRLTHPNIVGIFDYGETDEVAYIVMEYVEGRTLKSVVDAEERMAVTTVGKIMADLLAGLRYSHERGVVHRDIKPANIMIVGGDGHGSGQAKIADFGIARIESSNLTQAGTIMGTPAYMSPEQFMGQTVDARTDIYSSGVLLFQLLTGERPFEGSMATIMHKALNTVPPKPSELSVTAPVALDAVVARAMARRPEDRYPDAGAFATAVADAIEGRAAAPPAGLGDGLGDDFDGESTVVRPAAAARSSAPPTPTRAATATTQPPRSRSKAPLLAGVAVVVLAAAGAGGAWWSGLIGAPEPPNPQIAGGTHVISPPGAASGGQDTVVAVAPPSAPDASPPGQATATETSTPLPSSPPPPPPRTDVTQVVPPSTSPPEPRQTAQIIPPAAPPPTQPEPHPAGQTTRAEIAQNTRLEPAVVPPPASAAATITPATVTPAVTTATLAPATIANAPVAPVAPPQTRSPEPQVASPPPPAQATIPPETPPPAATVSTPPNVPATPAGTSTTAATTTAALVSPEALRRAVSTAVDGADCAAVRGDLTRSGTISLQGVIGSGAPTQDLLGHVRDAAPNAPLDWTVEEVNGPYCGALNLIRAYTRPFGSVSGGMDIGLKDGKTNLREDDRIEIRAQMPAVPSYLQVDYFSSDGSVLHVQTAAQGAAAFPPRSVQVYAPGSVASPFGTDLIISIASSVPLFNKGQTLPDEAEPYLRQLHTALDAAIKKRAELAAGVVVVHTSPKS